MNKKTIVLGLLIMFLVSFLAIQVTAKDSIGSKIGGLIDKGFSGMGVDDKETTSKTEESKTGMPFYDRHSTIIDFFIFFAIFLSTSYFALSKYMKDGKHAAAGIAISLAAGLAIAAMKAGMGEKFLLPFVKNYLFFLAVVALFILFTKVFGMKGWLAFILAPIIAFLLVYYGGAAFKGVTGLDMAGGIMSDYDDERLKEIEEELKLLKREGAEILVELKEEGVADRSLKLGDVTKVTIDNIKKKILEEYPKPGLFSNDPRGKELNDKATRLGKIVEKIKQLEKEKERILKIAKKKGTTIGTSVTLEDCEGIEDAENELIRKRNEFETITKMFESEGILSKTVTPEGVTQTLIVDMQYKIEEMEDGSKKERMETHFENWKTLAEDIQALDKAIIELKRDCSGMGSGYTGDYGEEVKKTDEYVRALSNRDYPALDSEMSARIESLDLDSERGVKELLNFKEDLVENDIGYHDTPKSWKLIKELMPGETTVHTDSGDDTIDGTYRVKTTPESGTTHFLRPRQELVFKSEVVALQGDEDDVVNCWKAEDMTEKYHGKTFTFRRDMKNPETGPYKVTLTVLKDPTHECDVNAPKIAEYSWNIIVSDNEDDYKANPKIVKYIPEDLALDVYIDESTTFKAIIENKNSKVYCEWKVDDKKKGTQSCSFTLGKCGGEIIGATTPKGAECEVEVAVKHSDNGKIETAGTLKTTQEWTVKTVPETIKNMLIESDLFPEDEDVSIVSVSETGEKATFRIKVSDKIRDYYTILSSYEWDCYGDLSAGGTRFDGVPTSTGTKICDYDGLPRETYRVTAKVPMVLNEKGRRRIERRQGENYISNHKYLTKVHYPTAWTQVLAGTVEKEEIDVIPKEDVVDKPIGEYYIYAGGQSLRVGEERIIQLEQGDIGLVPPEKILKEGGDYSWHFDVTFFSAKDISKGNPIKLTPAKDGTTEITVKTTDGKTIRKTLTIKKPEDPDPTPSTDCPHATESCLDGTNKVHLAPGKERSHGIQDIRKVKQDQPDKLWVKYTKQPSNLLNVEIGGKKYNFNVRDKCLELEKSGSDYYFKNLPPGATNKIRATIATGDYIYLSACSDVKTLSQVMQLAPTSSSTAGSNPKVKELQNMLINSNLDSLKVTKDGKLNTKTVDIITKALKLVNTEKAKNILTGGVTISDFEDATSFQFIKSSVQGYIRNEKIKNL